MGFDKIKAVRAAEKYLAQGKIPAAIQEYRRIVEQDTDDFSALNTLGDLYSRIDKKQEAVACFRRVAEHYREQGFQLKAIAMYKKITRFTPGDASVSLNLATLYEQQGLMVEARTQYLTVAEAHQRAGNTREALDVLRRVADLDPNNTDIRLRLAQGLMHDTQPELAADAFTDAGERLAARGDYERSLDSYTKALALRPHSHAALQGLVIAHTALGTADEAAEVLEQSVAANPGDLELRAMLARAYVEAENAVQAERVTDELVSHDSTSYALFFDVARLYLQQNNVERAVHLLGRMIEAALTARAEEPLLELLQEVLARDPEQMDALQLLARIHAWQHDDERLRSTLERIADAAESAGDQELERRTLAQLVRLAPNEPRYVARLQSLGGAQVSDEESPAQASAPPSDEVPTFESFMMPDQTPSVSTPVETFDSSVRDFDLQSAPVTEKSDASASFADLNDDFDAVSLSGTATAADATTTSGFQEVDFGAGLQGTPVPAEDAQNSPTNSERISALLAQELESIDFYLAQGYNDIARDTLDMLARQYGDHPDIEARRLQIPSGDSSEPVPAAFAEESAVHVATDNIEVVVTDFSAYDLSGGGEATAVSDTQEAEAELDAALTNIVSDAAASETSAAPATSAKVNSNADGGAGLDPGLAAIFDEFREAVEDVEPDTEADYETNYNFGLAYKDMDLLDQAIEAFQTAITMTAPGDGTPRYLQCCNMLGHCFMQREMPQIAAMWFKKGLEARGHTEDEYQALRYELGTAYEQMGDLSRAIDVFNEVYGINVSYRGVSDKLRELQSLKSK